MLSEVILRHFDTLVEQGLMPIPLRQNSKRPYGKGWNKNWVASKSRWYFQCEPNLNMGFLLGDIVDVEGDSPQANDKINELIGDYPHPSYRSRKSIHHLFLTPDPKLRRLQFRDVEFRGYGHQSVLPPSEHEGIRYVWREESVWPVPKMPDRLVSFYWQLQNKRKHQTPIKPGHAKVWCAKCQKEIYLHGKRWESELAIFKMLGFRWECQDCRQIDMRPLVRQYRRGTLSLTKLKRKAG